MTARLFPIPGLLLCLALAGCQTGLPSFGRGAADPAGPVTAGVAPESIETTALPPAGAVPAATTADAPAQQPAAAASVPAAVSTPAPALPAIEAPKPRAAPPEMAEAVAACMRKGGHFAPRSSGSSSWTCFTTPRDAGRSCQRASDCSSACLAGNRTCAPVAPLFGCHPVLSDRGEAVTQCID